MTALTHRLVPPPPTDRSAGVWAAAWERLRRDRLGIGALGVVAAFLLLIFASATGLVAGDWQLERGVPYAPPAFAGGQPGGPAEDGMRPARGVARQAVDIADVDPLAPRYAEWNSRAAKIVESRPPPAQALPLGADRWGRDVLAKAIKGTQISVFVGVFAALLATAIGTLLGAAAGYFRGHAGDLIEWVYNVFTAIPGILLVFSFAAVFGRGIGTVILILGLTGWTGSYRLVRAEYIKHAARDYVRAARAIGASQVSRIFVHIFPNISHVILVQLSLLVVAFIKAEVILSFLGLGVPIEMVSWGTMLGEAQNELITGKWWQLAAATIFMTVFVTAFSLLTDALRDALDPKLR
ncbi:MAG: ABC transporter permease [Betaproteobacteria bacterium]|nr:ABC transporter permease [Betaproteobacteria bacterium]